MVFMDCNSDRSKSQSIPETSLGQYMGSSISIVISSPFVPRSLGTLMVLINRSDGVESP